MARFLTAQRRAFLVFSAILFTLLIRLVSFSVGNSFRAGRGAVTVTDRGPFKQVAIRVAKLHSSRGLSLPFKFGFMARPSTNYMLRIANFVPFVMLENLGAASLLPELGVEMLAQSCSSDCDDCNCNCECDNCSSGCTGDSCYS